MNRLSLAGVSRATGSAVLESLDDAVAGAIGVPVAVKRAWPANDGELTFEATERNTGRIRAGRVHADGTVQAGAYCEDPKLETLAEAARAGDLLVHRYGRRAVIRSTDPEAPQSFIKVLRTGKSAAAARAHKDASALAAGSGVVVPQVLAEGAGSITLSTVPGRGLHLLGREVGAASQGPDDDGGAAARWMQAWRFFRRHWPRFARPVAGAIPSYSADDECRTVEKWAAHARGFGTLAVGERQLGDAADRVQQALLAGEAQKPVLAHRDLHDQQILFDPKQRSLGLIDCDTLAPAEPALDLANLAVHLEFRCYQGLLHPAAAAAAKAEVRRTADQLGVEPERTQAYSMATALRLACVYSFRPPYRRLAEDWFRGRFPS
ncbi:phosphotransferase [Arthrobacter castelli]|uniref:phosphotransferase n=1 Tax=Arthrobacter castelli TaxID=271431 RepID=UPI0004106857|nr:phosphotransferase [Arthrobacter castelli]